MSTEKYTPPTLSAAEDSPAPLPSNPPAAFVVVEDRLRAENATLRHQISVLRIQCHGVELERLRSLEHEAQRRLLVLQEQLTQKYNVDFSRHVIRDEDGAILPVSQ